MYQFPLNALTLSLAAASALPFDPDAVVYEQDTALILSTDNVIRESDASTASLIAAAEQQQPLALGSVLVHGDYPFEFFAIIHDVEQEPMCTPEAIVTALFNIVVESEKRLLSAVAMPLLGTVFGPMSHAESVYLIKDTLGQVRPRYLNTVLLVLPHEADIAPLFDMLRAV